MFEQKFRSTRTTVNVTIQYLKVCPILIDWCKLIEAYIIATYFLCVTLEFFCSSDQHDSAKGRTVSRKRLQSTTSTFRRLLCVATTAQYKGQYISRAFCVISHCCCSESELDFEFLCVWPSPSQNVLVIVYTSNMRSLKMWKQGVDKWHLFLIKSELPMIGLGLYILVEEEGANAKRDFRDSLNCPFTTRENCDLYILHNVMLCHLQ